MEIHRLEKKIPYKIFVNACEMNELTDPSIGEQIKQV